MCGCTALCAALFVPRWAKHQSCLVITETYKIWDEEKNYRQKLQHKIGMILLNKEAKKEPVLAPLPSTLTVVMLQRHLAFLCIANFTDPWP